MTSRSIGQIDNVIVTVVGRKRRFSVDMRCPCDKPIELLGNDIIRLLADEYDKEIKNPTSVRLYFNNHIISPGMTLASVGAWDGSYIYIDWEEN